MICCKADIEQRDKAWETCPYGCVGLFVFTFPTIQRTEIYEQILQRVKYGERFLDLGCGFGQNIRKLVHDGAPSENTAGADISQKFIEYGYEYFRDQESLKTKFIIGDVLDSSSPAFLEANGSFDIIFASMFYHLWGWNDHIKTLIRTVKLLRPVPGSTLFGWQMGSTPAIEITRELYENRLEQHKLAYQHDEESWVRMWREVEAKTDTKWDVRAKAIVTPEIKERQKLMPQSEGRSLCALFFTMTRL